MPAFLTDLLNIFASLCKIRLYPQSLRIQAVLFYVNPLIPHLMLPLCLHKDIKKAVTKFVTAWYSLWTSQGLNLGPPDYESVALTN